MTPSAPQVIAPNNADNVATAPTDLPAGVASVAQPDGATTTIDLSQPLSAEAFRAVFEAWMAHHVLRFKGQHLTKEQLLDFSARFGELDSSSKKTRSSGRARASGCPRKARSFHPTPKTHRSRSARFPR